MTSLREPVKLLSDEYVAGLFDGEGCVYCQRQWIKGKYEKYPRVHIQVSVTNQNLEVLRLLEEWFGGGTTRKAKKSDCFHWRVTGKSDLLKFLKTVRPYLVIKRFEVEQAIKFSETLREENLGCTPLTKEEHKVREEVYNALKKRKDKQSYQHS